MIINKECYGDLHEKYEKVKKLIEEDSKSDPETEPYKSKYAARKLLLQMQKTIENLLQSSGIIQETPEEFLRLKGMLGAVFLYLGIVTIDTEESAAKAAEYLSKCEDVTGEYEIHPEIVSVSLNMLNHYGILKAGAEPETAKKYLQKAETLYTNFKLLTISAWDVSDLFAPADSNRKPEEATRNLEKTHTLTLYYLAQIFGAQKDTIKSAIYCHVTLKRQLEQDDFDPIDWALNSAVLSQFFMEKNGFTEARHHLAAASLILDKYEADVLQQQQPPATSEEEHAAKLERFRHRSADVARCWSKYGLVLLSSSKDRLVSNSETPSSEEEPTLTEAINELRESVPQNFRDFNFRTVTGVSLYEDQVTDKFCLTYEDARCVFLNVQSWLHKAQEYYTLDNLASDFVRIVQDNSQLYNNLAFFEDDPEKQAKMHKRRIDLLENVFKELNPTYYLGMCRELTFELGEAYANVLYIKMDKLKELKDERPSAHALNKVNSLVEKNLKHLTWFVDSFKDQKTQKVPETLDKDYEMGYLKAWFSIASLHAKFLTLDKKVALSNAEKCLEAYKRVKDYADRNERVKEGMKLELGICKDMVELYPVKIMKLKREAEQSGP